MPKKHLELAAFLFRLIFLNGGQQGIGIRTNVLSHKASIGVFQPKSSLKQDATKTGLAINSKAGAGSLSAGEARTERAPYLVQHA